MTTEPKPPRKRNANRPDSEEKVEDVKRRWTFLSSHGQVMLCLSQHPDFRLREIAERVGITDRAVQIIIKDLVDEGYLTCSRVGRRNRYTLHTDMAMRHPIVGHQDIRTFLKLVDSQRED